MATRTTGAEFKRFMTDPAYWPNDAGDTYYDEEELVVNGAPLDSETDIETLADDDVVTIEGGIVFSPLWVGKEPSFEAFFKQWRKKQTSVTLLIECDRAVLEAVKAAIKAAGGKVQG